jgi:hypothetical protein
MIEYFGILAFLFLVAIFFYKQALEEFDVLQIEANQLEQLPKLLSEQSFLVVRSLPEVHLWNPNTIKEIPRIQKAPYGKHTLIDIVSDSKTPLPTTYPLSSEKLAEHTGIHTWIQTMWLPKILDNPWLSWLFHSRTEACIGRKGLRKSTAYSTLILPTEGDLMISVMPESSETYLPKKWRGRTFSEMKRAEAPLIGEIKFLDIKVRQGSALFVPPHWILNIEQEGETVPWFLWSEFHHPLSKLAHTMSSV